MTIDTNTQNLINMLANYIINATDADGKKIFYPFLFQENWSGLLDALLEKASPYGSWYSGMLKLEDNNASILVLDTSFMYIFCEALDGLNLFDIASPKFLTHIFSRKFHQLFALSDKSFCSEIVIPDRIEKLPPFYFSEVGGIEKVSFSNNSKISELPAGLFWECSDLKYLQLTNRIAKINIGAIPTANSDLEIKVIKQSPTQKWEVEIPKEESNLAEFLRSHVKK